MGAVHHEGIAIYTRLSQVSEDLGKHPQAGPPDEAVVQRLVRSIHRRRILPAQAVAQDMEDAAQHPAIIHTRLAPGLWKVRPEPLDLLVSQPELSRHAALQSRAA